MKKIVVYGAGQIGTCVMAELALHAPSDAVEVVMYAPHNHQRVLGAKLDLDDAAVMAASESGWRFKVTDNPDDFADADAVVVSAGGLPSKEEYLRAEQQGIDDRTVQGKFNIKIMRAFADTMHKCPHAVIFVLSNPVDMMCDIIREMLPTHQVYGLGCWLDTARFRRELWEIIHKENPRLNVSEIKAYIIGHHNDTMFVSAKSVEGLPVSPQQIETALTNTRRRGLFITQTNAKATTPKANNGSYWAPAIMVTDVLQAFVSGELLLPMNRRILPQESAELANFYAQLPCRIANGAVEAVPTELTTSDIANLRNCIETSRANVQKLMEFVK